MNKPAKRCTILRLHPNVISRVTPLEESILMRCYAMLTGVSLMDVSEGSYLRYSGFKHGKTGAADFFEMLTAVYQSTRPIAFSCPCMRTADLTYLLTSNEIQSVCAI